MSQIFNQLHHPEQFKSHKVSTLRATTGREVTAQTLFPDRNRIRTRRSCQADLAGPKEVKDVTSVELTNSHGGCELN